MSGRKNESRSLSAFKQSSRASKLLALVPPVNVSSDLEGESDCDEIFKNSSDEELDYSSSDAPSIPPLLQDISLSSSEEEQIPDEISNSEPDSFLMLTPIMRQVLPSGNQVNFDIIPTLSSIQSILSEHNSPVPAVIRTRAARKRVLPQIRRKVTTSKKPKTTNYKWKKGKLKNQYKAEIVDVDYVFVMLDDDSPLEYFYKYFSRDIFQDIVDNTNLYSVQQSTGRSICLTEDELKDFISILLLMGIVKLPSYLDYWSKEFRYPPVADTIALKRFQTIRRYLHFTDNSCHDSDRYTKVRPFVEKVRLNCLSTEEETSYSIDEMTIPYKGKKAGNRRQYNPMKPNKWGLKNFVHAGASGIVYDFLLYAGEDTFRYIEFSQYERSLTLGAKVVVALCKTIQTPACAVYFDNYFSTLDLAVYLRDSHGIFSLGTIRQNKLKGCQNLLLSDKAMKKKGRGAYSQIVDNEHKLVVIEWFDNKIVTLLCTYADAFPMGKIKRYSKEHKAYIDIDCPQIIKFYNKHMGGVDLCHMLIALYRTPYKRI